MVRAVCAALIGKFFLDRVDIYLSESCSPIAHTVNLRTIVGSYIVISVLETFLSHWTIILMAVFLSTGIYVRTSTHDWIDRVALRVQ